VQPPEDKVYENVDISKPEAKIYDRKTGSIVTTLKSLLEKAESHLEKLQGAETSAVHNYAMIKASLLDGQENLKGEMSDAKARIPEKQEANSVAAGDLQSTSEDLLGDARAKEALHHECLSVAEEFQTSMAGRSAELKALTDAQKAIADTTGGAASQTYALAQTPSLLQTASSRAAGPISAVRALATKLGSTVLAQLASRMSSALQLGTASDPFSKVKELLENMIQQLATDADNDATLKAYCDREMASIGDKKDDAVSEKDRLGTRIEQKKARSSKLRGLVSTLQQELASLAKAQEEARQLRNDEHNAFLKNKNEMEQGLRGIKLAVKVLKEHYSQDSESELLTHGASGGIIGMLEVVESDFTTGLAELLVAEESAATYYQSTLKPSTEVETAAKEHDMKLKQKEYASVEKAGADLATDAAHASEKLSAIHQYEAMIKSKCSKPDSFEERKDRREKELAGLKDAMMSLAGESPLLQTDSMSSLRGSRRHSA
jgi:hypothetical protein